jgi:hypothetical protein
LAFQRQSEDSSLLRRVETCHRGNLPPDRGNVENMIASSPSCADCTYWSSHEQGGRGSCRRYPPSSVGFPTVLRSNWCGEHKILPSEAPTLVEIPIPPSLVPAAPNKTTDTPSWVPYEDPGFRLVGDLPSIVPTGTSVAIEPPAPTPPPMPAPSPHGGRKRRR